MFEILQKCLNNSRFLLYSTALKYYACQRNNDT